MKDIKPNPDMFEIDMNALEHELIMQPKLYFEFAEQLADASFNYEKAKANFSLVRATMEHTIRSQPVKYGLKGSPAIAIVEGRCMQTTEYLKAQKKVHLRKLKFDLLVGAVKALDHRKSALERLVSLHGQNYFSKPQIDPEHRPAVEEATSKHTRRKTKVKRKKGKARK